MLKNFNKGSIAIIEKNGKTVGILEDYWNVISNFCNYQQL